MTPSGLEPEYSLVFKLLYINVIGSGDPRMTLNTLFTKITARSSRTFRVQRVSTLCGMVLHPVVTARTVPALLHLDLNQDK